MFKVDLCRVTEADLDLFGEVGWSAGLFRERLLAMIEHQYHFSNEWHNRDDRHGLFRWVTGDRMSLARLSSVLVDH